VFLQKDQAIGYAEPRAYAKSRRRAALLSVSLDCSDQSHVGSLVLIHFIEDATLIVNQTDVARGIRVASRVADHPPAARLTAESYKPKDKANRKCC
jgi:hypothetical protein